MCLSIVIKGVEVGIRYSKRLGAHWKVAAAGSLVAVAVVGVMFMPRIYWTGASEWQSVKFSDGTVTQMGPVTAMLVRYERGQRRIRIIRGEATFDVAKDPSRPFLVRCGIGEVQALGTKFAVQCDGKVSNVVVSEGSVSIARRLKRAGQPASTDQIRSDAGGKVLVDQWTPLFRRTVDVHKEMAWERGRIVFDGVPVELAIYEFSRRHKVEIPIPTYIGENYLVFGEFDLTKPDQFMEFLRKSPALQHPAKKR